ncbi:MAG TPA: FAD-dependent oxidoreductase [Bacteroidales bacterium]|mgnify:CR=1 FL=1
MIKKYLSRVVSIQNHFEGLYTLEFESLGGTYKYLPGQFLHLALDLDYDGSGQWPESRCFSMQSNPNDKNVTITYSVKGNFTKQMQESLKVGSEVWLKMPYGDLFTQEHSKENTVFVAGGTGVTPFLSLFCHESFKEYNKPKLYLGLRDKNYHIYKDALKKAIQVNPDFEINILYESENGKLNIEDILKKNGNERVYFISGPPMMIKNFKTSLIATGVDESLIKTDDWE